MTEIIIKGASKAIRAGTWAEEHFKSGWSLVLNDPFSGRFSFKFNNPKDAEFFALKWV